MIVRLTQLDGELPNLIPRRIRGDLIAPMLWTQPTLYPHWCYGFGGVEPVLWGEFADWSVVRQYHAATPLRATGSGDDEDLRG